MGSPEDSPCETHRERWGKESGRAPGARWQLGMGLPLGAMTPCHHSPPPPAKPSLATLVQAHHDWRPGGPAAPGSQVWPPTLESSRWATKVAKALHTLHCFSEQVSSEATWMPTWGGKSRWRSEEGRNRAHKPEARSLVARAVPLCYVRRLGTWGRFCFCPWFPGKL